MVQISRSSLHSIKKQNSGQNLIIVGFLLEASEYHNLFRKGLI